METTIDTIGDDLLQNILSRLPTLACANATCVSRSWNLIINSLLSSPNLSYARSFWPSLQEAVNEAVEKVLSRPIRPQFVIASIPPPYSLQIAHQLIYNWKIRLQNSIITLVCQGIFGRNAVNDEFEEVQHHFIENMEAHPNRGVSLTVGFFPGLRVSLIPLLAKTQIYGYILDEAQDLSIINEIKHVIAESSRRKGELTERVKSEDFDAEEVELLNVVGSFMMLVLRVGRSMIVSCLKQFV